MLEKWLSIAETRPSPYVFRFINVTENQTPDDDVKAFIGKEIVTAYRNLDYLQLQYRTEPRHKLVEYINNYVLTSSDNQIAKNVGQGDFGEILAGLIVSHFFKLFVPIQKLRWKFNKDRSTFCTDMIAHNPDGNITDIYYYEIKSRLLIRKEETDGTYNHITVVAHNGLLKDEQTPNEGIADFLSRYFYEREDYDASAKYGDIVRNPSNYNRNFELFFVIEASKFKVEILDDLQNLPPTLKPLCVTLVLINGLGELIQETRELAISSAVNYVYGA